MTARNPLVLISGALQELPPGDTVRGAGAISAQEFSTSGTWTKPEGASFVMVEAWGAGGGGSSGGVSSAGSNQRTGGTGGGGGAYYSKLFKASDLPESVVVTVGLGGAGGVASTSTSSAGIAGGSSSFGDLLIAQGGKANGTGGGPTGTSVGATQVAEYGGGGASNLAISGTMPQSGSSLLGGAGGQSGGGSSLSGTNLTHVAASAPTSFGYFGLAAKGGQASGYEIVSSFGPVYANGTFVQRAGTGHIAVSTDGINWQIRTAVSSAALVGFVFDGVKWVGHSLVSAYTSTDLVTWTSVNSTGSQYWNSLAYGAGTFVRVGNSGHIATSTNLTTWTTRTSGITAHINQVIFDGTRWIAVSDKSGTYAKCLTSTDAITWTAVDTVSTSNLTSVASSGSVIVAVATNFARAAISTDGGVTWAASTGVFPLASSPQLLYTGTQFVSTTGTSVVTSPDGQTWTTRPDNSSDFLYGVAYSGSVLFVGSNTNNANPGIYSTDDGVTWSACPTSVPTVLVQESGQDGVTASGGGGGAPSTTDFLCGAGGKGGDGLVRVYTW